MYIITFNSYKFISGGVILHKWKTGMWGLRILNNVLKNHLAIMSDPNMYAITCYHTEFPFANFDNQNRTKTPNIHLGPWQNRLRGKISLGQLQWNSPPPDCSGTGPDFREQDEDTWKHKLILTDSGKWASNFHLGIFQKENEQIIFIPPRGTSTMS